MISVRKLLIKSSQFPDIPILSNFKIISLCHTLSDAFDICRNTAWVSSWGKHQRLGVFYELLIKVDLHIQIWWSEAKLISIKKIILFAKLIYFVIYQPFIKFSTSGEEGNKYSVVDLLLITFLWIGSMTFFIYQWKSLIHNNYWLLIRTVVLLLKCYIYLTLELTYSYDHGLCFH